MEPNKSLDCECGKVDRPVNAFGDFICRAPNSSVRDIIRKFEREASDSLRSNSSLQSRICSPNKYSTQKLQKRVVYEEQGPPPQRAVQTNVKRYFSKQFVIRARDKVPEKKPVLENDMEKLTTQQKPQGSSTGKSGTKKDKRNVSYPSKTTIRKTSFGVRIIVDINFDTRTKIENWHCSRIATEIPSSDILSEFQKKVV